MGVILIPLLYYPIIYWGSEFKREEYDLIIEHIFQVIISCIVLVALFYVGFVRFYKSERERMYFRDERIWFADCYAPIVGFLAVMCSLFLLVLLPFFIAQTKSANSHKNNKQN